MCLRQLPSRRRRWQAAMGTALLLGLLGQEWQKGEAVLRVLRLGCSEGKADPPALSWKYPTMPWGSCSPFHSIGPFQPNFLLFLSLLLADISLPIHAPRFLCSALGSHLWRRQVPPASRRLEGERRSGFAHCCRTLCAGLGLPAWRGVVGCDGRGGFRSGAAPGGHWGRRCPGLRCPRRTAQGAWSGAGACRE